MLIAVTRPVYCVYVALCCQVSYIGSARMAFVHCAMNQRGPAPKPDIVRVQMTVPVLSLISRAT